MDIAIRIYSSMIGKEPTNDAVWSSRKPPTYIKVNGNAPKPKAQNTRSHRAGCLDSPKLFEEPEANTYEAES